MARIRTIKPDFWTDEKVLGIKPLTRLLFIGMWNFADDYGRLDFSPVSLKAKIFPGDDISAADMRDMLNELCIADLLLIYSANDKEYIEITGWHHQRIDKRQVSKIPGPFDDGSNIRGLPPTSPDRPRLTTTPAPVMEGNGRGMEGKQDADAARPAIEIVPPDPQARFFHRAVEVLGPSGRSLAAKLLKSKGGVVTQAESALVLAAGKADPREYIGAIIRSGDPPQQAAGRSW